LDLLFRLRRPNCSRKGTTSALNTKTIM